MLQFHRVVSTHVRPVPAFEVISSANFNVRLTKEITKVFRAKHAVCPNDLVVLRAENYTTADQADEHPEAQDIIGLICNRRKDIKDEASSASSEKAKVKICMASGVEWEACCLPSGGYEFFTTDSHGLGLKVRWVPKRNTDGSRATTKDGNLRFNFSTISATSRRHPVIAILSNKEVEVYDTYRVPDANVTPTPTPKRNSDSALAAAMDHEGASLMDQRETDDELREIITMTAIFVVFKEGWSPSFKYDESRDRDVTGGGMTRAASSMSTNNSPSKSALSLVSTPPGSPQDIGLEKRGSIKSISSNIMRRSSMLGGKSNRASQVSVPEEDLQPIESPLSRSDSVTKKTGRARGDSTSTVLVHRAASNRRKNNQQATWRPDLLQAQQHSVRETSSENLNATPPSQEQQPQRQEAWESPEAVPTTPTGGGVAEPLIPNTVESPPRAAAVVESPPTSAPMPKAFSGPQAQRTLRPATPVNPDKRVSDATTTTTRSSVMPRSTKTVKSGGRKGGWRRLLCGGTQDI